MKETKKRLKIGKILLEHIENNAKDYLIVSLIFLIGIVLGIVFINQANESTKTEITNYIMNFKETLQGENQVDKIELLKESLGRNIVLGIGLWFIGSTVIGIPVVYAIITYRGFCIGYTLSAMVAVLGNKSGIIFAISSVLLQNIIFIPAVLAISVSGMKLYHSILKDKRKENIKLEIVRHTIFCTFMIFLFMLSSLIEVYLSTNILQVLIKYI